jgi:hypothetical protein
MASRMHIICFLSTLAHRCTVLHMLSVPLVFVSKPMTQLDPHLDEVVLGRWCIILHHHTKHGLLSHRPHEIYWTGEFAAQGVIRRMASFVGMLYTIIIKPRAEERSHGGISTGKGYSRTETCPTNAYKENNSTDGERPRDI